MRLMRWTSRATKRSLPSLGASCDVLGAPRRPLVTPSNAASITTASAHLEPIHCTCDRASMKRASAWLVRRTTRKPMTKA